MIKFFNYFFEGEEKNKKQIAGNVSAMSSGGFRTTYYQNTTNKLRSTNDR